MCFTNKWVIHLKERNNNILSSFFFKLYFIRIFFACELFLLIQNDETKEERNKIRHRKGKIKEQRNWQEIELEEKVRNKIQKSFLGKIPV